MKIKFTKDTFYTILTFILCSFIAVIFAIINRFPLVYSDTGTYIVSGYEFDLPFDRPVFYGLFLRHTSMHLSLWLTIMAQAGIGVFLIRELIIYFKGWNKNTNMLTIIAVLLLSISSSFSYTTSELIADIFTPFLVLCMLLWNNSQMPGYKKWIIAFIFCYSLLTHNSHFLIVLSCLVSLFLINYLFSLNLGKSLKSLLYLTLLTLLFNLSFNALKHKGFQLSRVSSAFLFARMLETGAIHEYVASHPEEHDLISDHINEIPQKSVDFLWDADHSVLYSDSCLPKNGWEFCWCDKNPLFKSYIKKVLFYKPARNTYLLEISKSFLRQLHFYSVESLAPLTTDYPVKINVKIYMKYDYPAYITAMQYGRVLNFKITNTILFYSSILSLFILIAGMIYLKNNLLNKLLLIYFMFYIFNAFICSSFSNTTERYTSRISWILPLLAFIAILLFIQKYRDSKSIQVHIEATPID